MGQFQTIPINIVGGTHENRSRPVSVQNTTNMFVNVNPYSDKDYSLQSFYGQKLISSVSGENERGVHVMNEVAYRVVDETLYQVGASGEHIQRGRVEGKNRVIMDNDGDNLVIVADRVYVYTASDGSFVENTNENLVDVLSVTVINSQFIYTTSSLSFVSQPGNPFNLSGLDAIGAESSPDPLVRDYVFDQTIYRFGTRKCEPWYNSGVGSPPIDRIEGQQFSVGLWAIHSVANTDNAVYWLGDDNSIYRVSGGVKDKVSDDALSTQIEKMPKTDDAIGFSLTIQGQDFYVITFPSGNKTYLLNEKLGVNGWTSLSSTNLNSAYSATNAVEVYNKTYVVSGGKWLQLVPDEYTQDTDIMLRRRTTGMIQAKDLNLSADSLMMSKLYLDVEQGVGLITGQGERPRLMVEVSIDGGRSFPHVEWMELGQLGEYTLRTEVDLMVLGDSFVFRFNLSDPVPLTIKGGELKVKGMGR